jgi:glutamine---fructose-6-phosphate transaminase (isomerizing)
VQIDKDTLVIALISSNEFQIQANLIADIAKKSKHLIVFSRNEQIQQITGCIPVLLPDCGADAVSAIHAQYCIQMICFFHALMRGANPDMPKGLDAWIFLQ